MRTPGGVFYRRRTGKQRAGTGHPYSAWFYAVSQPTKEKNMVGTKEFYDLMEMFEKNIKRIYIPGTNSLNKEPKELWKLGRIYADGNVNSAFQAYMYGYSFGKIQCQ